MSVYTNGNMNEFTPGFSPIKYGFHLLMIFGSLTLFLGALVNFNLIILFIVGAVIFVLLYELYSLKSQHIIIDDSTLTFFKKSIFNNEVTIINLADVSSFELLTYRGRYDLVTRHSVKFRTAVNRDEPKLYTETQTTLNLGLWDNSHVQAFVSYLKNTYPSVIWR